MFKYRRDFYAAACSQPVQASQLKSLKMYANLICLSGGLYCMLQGGLKQL
ncbi:hypothetical protein IMY05_002G0119100 [Salix suchowensis]|nr:hypothetical protein IMY05_002G0119100 [Salix suchowensis]